MKEIYDFGNNIHLLQLYCTSFPVPKIHICSCLNLNSLMMLGERVFLRMVVIT